MYLSTDDFNFLMRLHNDFLCLSEREARARLNADETLWDENGEFKSDEIRIAHYMSESDYIYFVEMIQRLAEGKKRVNDRQKVYMRKKRLHNKHYGR